MSEMENNLEFEGQKNVVVDAVEMKTIEIRISGIKDATKRSRFVFIVMTIATATILITIWNQLLSWDRGMAFDEKSRIEHIADNQKETTHEWIKNLTISVGLLGIRVSATDLSVIGSASLLIIMVWFFFSQRRENRAIVSLLRYCSEGLINKQLSKDVCKLVYEGVVQSIVFIDMGGGDKPIKGLDSGAENQEKVETTFFIRTILKILVFLPPFTILMIVVSDIWSLFITSYVRDTDEMLYKILFDGKHNIAATKVFAFELFALATCIYTWFLCKKSRDFSKASADTIKQYKTAIDTFPN